MFKQRELDQIQQQLQILAATFRSKTNQIGTANNSILHTFLSSFVNLNKDEIIYRAKKAYKSEARLKIFEDATSSIQSIYYHYLDVFGPNPVPEWVDQYLKLCDNKEILSISSFNEFISTHLLSGQTSFSDPNKNVIPELSDADAPGYIRKFASERVTNKELLEKINKLFPLPQKQPKGLYYPKLPDLGTTT